MDNSSNFLDNLRKSVKESGKSQKELAADAGITPVTLNRWLQGKREPREEELNRLLAVLGTNSEIIQQNNQQEENEMDKDNLVCGKRILFVLFC